MKKKILKTILLTICFYCIFFVNINDVDAGYRCDGNPTVDFGSSDDAGTKICSYPYLDVGFNNDRRVIGRVSSDKLQLCIGYGTTGIHDPTIYTYSTKSSYAAKVKNKNEKDVYICPVVYMCTAGEWVVGDIGYKSYSNCQEAAPYWWSAPTVGEEPSALLCLGTKQNIEALQDAADALYNEVTPALEKELKFNTRGSFISEFKSPFISPYTIDGQAHRDLCSLETYNAFKRDIENGVAWSPDFFQNSVEEAIVTATDIISIIDGLEIPYTYGGEKMTMQVITEANKDKKSLDIYGDDIRMTCNENCGTVTTNYCQSDNYKKIEKLDDLLKKIEDYQASIIQKMTECEQLPVVELTEDLKEKMEDAKQQSEHLTHIYETGQMSSVGVLGSDTIVTDCEALLDEDLQKVLKWALSVVRIGAPIILIVMITVDFGQAVISQDQEAVKKATSKAVKRAIAAIALFFIPYIVELLLDMIGITGGSCGL